MEKFDEVIKPPMLIPLKMSDNFENIFYSSVSG